MIIELLKKAGIVLKTAGKYCKEDITITPALEDLVVETYEHGRSFTPSDGKIGFGSVEVKAHGSISLGKPTIEVTSDGIITATSKSQSYGTYLLAPNQTAKQTYQLPTKGATAITPTKESQIAVEAGTYTTGDVVVTPIPDNYVDMDQLPTKGATAITPTKESQIAVEAGVYTTGAVTVNPIPDNYINANEVNVLDTCDLTIVATSGSGIEVIFSNVRSDTGNIETITLAALSGNTSYAVPIGSCIVISNPLDSSMEWTANSDITDLSSNLTTSIQVFQINGSSRLRIA